MAEKKASMIKVSSLPGVIKHKSLKEAIRAISEKLATQHAKEIAKAAKKVIR